MSAISQDRRAKFLKKFALNERRGLEIGPFDKPVFSRADYPNVLYADVKDTVELRRLAAASPRREADNVVTVDYVLLDKQLDEVVPPASLDFVFCSHVLEHVPDMIGVLQSVERILAPGGVFLMAFPDRHFTYDIDRPATTLDQLLDRHARKVTRPDPDTVEEHFLFHRKVFVGRLWNNMDEAKGPRVFTADHARNRAEAARNTYIDVHCNVLDAREFGSVVDAVNARGLIRLTVHTLSPTRAPLNEFYVALQKPGAVPESFLRRSVRRLLGRT